MVDQLANRVITVSMCLRSEGVEGMIHINSPSGELIFWSCKGFPHADRELRNWLYALRDSTDQITVARKLQSFLYSVFTVTKDRLAKIDASNVDNGRRQEFLAKAFHDKMLCLEQSDTLSETPNEYRLNFFQEIVETADKVSFRWFQICAND